MSALTTTPDVMVLGGGGTLGEAWMQSVLAGLDGAEDFDARASRLYVGTSAGSIVAAILAAGLAPSWRLGDLPEQAIAPGESERASGWLGEMFDPAARIGMTLAGPAASVLLNTTASGGALMRRALLARVPPGRRSLGVLRQMIDDAGLSWDGRLRITAVDLASGRRAVFGAPGFDDVPVGAAVEASCAIPGVFRPVVLGGRSYVDGGVWSPTNMDAADVRRGERVLCLNPTGSLGRAGGRVGLAIGPLSSAVAAGEAAALRHRGATVQVVSPDRGSAAAMGTNLMDPGRRDDVIAAGFAQGSALLEGPASRAA